MKAGLDMLIILLLILIGSSWAIENVEITEPVDGETYDGDWLTVRAIVENDNELPDSVHHTLNGEPFILIPRLNTDWYTYMQNDLHHGFSESPAPTDNTIFWTAPITGTVHEFPTPVVVDGLVYYPQNSGGDTLFALDAATGAVEWMFTGTGSTDDAVTVKDGRLYTASDSIWCLDALTGDRIWAFGDANWKGSTPVVSNGRVYCARRVSTPSESYVYCLDADTGIELWSSWISGWTTSCMTAWQDMLFVATAGGSLGRLYALDAFSGDSIWVNTDAESGYWDSSPTVYNGVIYIGCDRGYLRGIDAITGETIWTTDFGHFISATPAYHEGSLYLGTNNPFFASVNALNGTFNWTNAFAIHGSPGVADGMVFFGENDNPGNARVIVLDCDTGAEVWSYTTSGDNIYSSPSITDGVVYIAGMDGNLYAFGTGLKYTYLDDLFAQVGANELIVTSFDEDIAVAADTINFTVTGTGINLKPSDPFSLCAAPNPFSSSLSISYSLEGSSEVGLSVYDLSGRLVENLVSGSISAGKNMSVWTPAPSLPDGCYLIVLDAYGERAVRRCVLLR